MTDRGAMTPELLCPKCNSEVHLPQITTAEEWAALPFGAIAVSSGGTVIHRTVDPDELRHWWGRETLFPLTVVWQPSADRVTT